MRRDYIVRQKPRIIAVAVAFVSPTWLKVDLAFGPTTSGNRQPVYRYAHPTMLLFHDAHAAASKRACVYEIQRVWRITLQVSRQYFKLVNVAFSHSVCIVSSLG